ncbi:antibiotic biosynthesis monooxygenase [Terrimonas sp. NA20]|uniref:Antibiotic biosynthesis monooxygenase n=1 Tax=Terrimonas ginsenosidimutans TaxID=2908004 RepID=A0ABS9KK59_9BACT|nr:antibiotic biosynthesis monooxygenase family protein [Terrimonas ginsenosidimutans]MCG2612707.1 antibiotic biosynthesis monooxygenase [Terrimonas ginsenosidimutans]
MKNMSRFLLILLTNLLILQVINAQQPAASTRMIRIAELEIIPQYLTEYKKILQEEAAAAIAKEPGVVAIFPMAEAEHPTKIRILEIYADKAAYEAHLKTPHFLHYKTTTTKMVASLKLVEMDCLDSATMAQLFKKMPSGQ